MRLIITWFPSLYANRKTGLLKITDLGYSHYIC